MKNSSLVCFLDSFRDVLVSTQEFVNTIRQIQKASNENIDSQVSEIINQFDHNKDGFIEVDEILEVRSFSRRVRPSIESLRRHWN